MRKNLLNSKDGALLRERAPPPGRLDEFGSVVGKCVSKGEVDSKEKPSVAAAFHYRIRGAVSQRIGIPSVVHAVRRAFFVSDYRRARAIDDRDVIFGDREVHDGQRHRGVHQILRAGALTAHRCHSTRRPRGHCGDL